MRLGCLDAADLADPSITFAHLMAMHCAVERNAVDSAPFSVVADSTLRYSFHRRVVLHCTRLAPVASLIPIWRPFVPTIEALLRAVSLDRVSLAASAPKRIAGCFPPESFPAPTAFAQHIPAAIPGMEPISERIWQPSSHCIRRRPTRLMHANV